MKLDIVDGNVLYGNVLNVIKLSTKKISIIKMGKIKQPDWCNYIDANDWWLGCWSLTEGLVTGEEFCKKCEYYKKKEE